MNALIKILLMMDNCPGYKSSLNESSKNTNDLIIIALEQHYANIKAINALETR
jgi:hypothetical protein